MCPHFKKLIRLLILTCDGLHCVSNVVTRPCSRDLAYGKGTTAPLRGSELPTVEKRDAWDGKDGEVSDNG